MGSIFNCNAALNFKGDTLLHYACARKNYSLVRYLTNRSDVICSVRNIMDETPLDLIEGDDEISQQIKKVCS
jgi:ankyrin repeat protein